MTRSIAVARLYFPDGHCEKQRLICLDSRDNVVGIEALTYETAFTLWHRGEAHLLPEGKLQLTPSLHNGCSHSYRNSTLSGSNDERRDSP